MFYRSFKEHKFMNKLLRSLKGGCYIFSNGNEPHVEEVTKKMKLQKIMNDMANIDEYTNEKPHRDAFEHVISKFGIEKDDQTYFFEDNIDNLETAKNHYGWKTILIDPDTNFNDAPEYVDFVFPNIRSALLMFINHTLSNDLILSPRSKSKSKKSKKSK
jgi:FMN phosphatase YigB (HAD superfamily)